MGDVMKVIVKEGDSVTLPTDDTELQTDDKRQWCYEDNLIAELTGGEEQIYDDDERFSGKLRLDKKTGDLNISNIKTIHSGLYKLKITRKRCIIPIPIPTYKRFILTVETVTGEEVKVIVKEGEPVTLNTGDTELQTDDEIQWWYGDNLIAEITGGKGQTHDVDDERFSGKLRLDEKTGSLIISDTKSILSGLYKLKISCKKCIISRPKRFIVTVNLNTELATVGESLTLSIPSEADLQKDDLILWKFGPTGSAIAKFDREITKYDGPDERFRNKLNLDEKTGSLTITNIKPEHAGVYELLLSNNNRTRNRKYKVKVPVEIVQASIGHSVTLPNDNKIQTGDQLTWLFEDENSPIAEIKGGTDLIAYKDRLHLDKAGSLTISKIRMKDAGLYNLKIISSISKKTTNKPFCVYIEVPVKEGETARLETGVENLQNVNIFWSFGDKNSTIAKIKEGADPIIHDDVLNGRFKGRLELNKKTGTLSIKNINTDDSGKYVCIKRSTNKSTHLMFTVSVSGSAGKVTGKKPIDLKAENGASELVTVEMPVLSDEQQSSV